MKVTAKKLHAECTPVHSFDVEWVTARKGVRYLNTRKYLFYLEENKYYIVQCAWHQLKNWWARHPRVGNPTPTLTCLRKLQLQLQYSAAVSRWNNTRFECEYKTWADLFDNLILKVPELKAHIALENL